MNRSDRFESVVLIFIVLLVGGAAGYASFSHVHDWTITNSPAGTSTWFGWINAVISELVPIAALLELRRRRRRDPEAPVGYPLSLLIGAAGLSLAAQLAVAKPGVSGWLLSAVPAVAFMALVKLVLAGKSETPDELPQASISAPPVSAPPVVQQPAPPTYLPPIVKPPAPPALGALATGGVVKSPTWAVLGDLGTGTFDSPVIEPAPEPDPEPEPTPEPVRPEPVRVPVGFAQPPAKPAHDFNADTVETPAVKPPATSARRRPTAGRPLEETRRLVDAVLATEPGLSQQKLADRIGIPRRTVRDALALGLA